YATEIDDLKALSEFYCIPYCEVDMLDIDPELFDKFTFEYMRKNKFMPVERQKDGTVLICMSRPLDFGAMSAIAAVFCANIDCVLVPASQIDRYLDLVAAGVSTSAALSDLNSERDQKLFEEIRSGVEQANNVQAESVINNPAVRLVDSIIREAIPYRASDIHIEPSDRMVRVRYRIDGDLQVRAQFPIEAYSAICARLKIMSGINIAEKRIPQDGRINMTVGGRDYDFRVSTLPTVHGEKFVIRILDKTSFHFTRSDLGFNEEENLVVDKMLARPHGIVLLTGPTGCGKSTTLYSFLKEINKPSVNIVTVEDPVEYTMQGITQTQINPKANLTFATGLRSILRQDPDIVMIGEIRDEETAEIAIRAAITGHLVFSTLHTNDAPGSITRLEDMGVPDYLVADALVGTIAQRLVKRLCPACKKRGKTTQKEMQILGLSEPVSISRPHGCQYCNNTGYKGRVAVHEIMYVNEEMRNVITQERNIEILRNMAAKNGMVDLFTSCKALVLSGVTSVQELMTLNIE
ncbi:MAG: type II/IV secretion system protein, partial [Eggerthellaceae bacterium]|nr:type II/IV secretion system protein [Eggerthellaceae bacterium]